MLCFLLLEDGRDPSYFNNNQQRLQATAFLVLCLVVVAGWLWRLPQAEQNFLINNPECEKGKW